MSLIFSLVSLLLSVLAFQVRHHSPTLQFCAELHFDLQTLAYFAQFCWKAMSNFILICSLRLFFKWWLAWGGKFVEIYDTCFSRQMCHCGQLRAIAWVFAGVKQVYGKPVLHLSLIALLRHCSPSLRHVSYPAPLRPSVCEFHGTWMLTNMIEPTWMHVKVNLRPY